MFSNTVSKFFIFFIWEFEATRWRVSYVINYHTYKYTTDIINKDGSCVKFPKISANFLPGIKIGKMRWI